MSDRTVFHTPPRNQGQIVEVSYALVGSTVIRRTYDQSDRSIEFARSKSLISDEGDYWQTTPANRRWRKISEAEAQRYEL